VGYQLDRVQRGLEPDDWKPRASVGAGVREIRVHDEAGAFHVICIAVLAGAVYVLHAFRKKTQQTSRRDLELAATRLRQISQRRT
jgi:phage-related protein